jgi:ammonia channel protein AmtB
MMWACMAAGSIINFQWYFWGYSLTFSPTGKSGFIGDLKNFGLIGTLGAPSPGSPLVPSLLYSFYQVGYVIIAGTNLTTDLNRCNSAPSQLPSSLAPWPNEAD